MNITRSLLVSTLTLGTLVSCTGRDIIVGQRDHAGFAVEADGGQSSCKALDGCFPEGQSCGCHADCCSGACVQGLCADAGDGVDRRNTGGGSPGAGGNAIVGSEPADDAGTGGHSLPSTSAQQGGSDGGGGSVQGAGGRLVNLGGGVGVGGSSEGQDSLPPINPGPDGGARRPATCVPSKSASFAAGPEPSGGVTSLAAADLNGDGNLDLAAGSYDEGSVLFGNGDGTFGAAQTSEVGREVASADVNHDGVLDIVDAGFRILPGKGDGRFNAPAITSSRSFAMADFNRDGNLDTAKGGVSSDLYVGFGNGKGAFGERIVIFDSPVGDLVAGDVTGDGNPDILALENSPQTSTVRIFVGNGDGTFQAPSDLQVEVGVRTMMLADLDEDGRLDLVTANFGTNEIEMRFGNGNGTFRTGTPRSVGASPLALAAYDLNGDGHLDLIVGNDDENTISVLLGNGNGTFGTENTYLVGYHPRSLAVYDLDRNGTPEVIVGLYGPSKVVVLSGVPNPACTP